jgi:hypothetical protein
MPHVRVQVEIAADTLLPRDRIINVLHFNEDEPIGPDLTDWEGYADDIKGVYQTLIGTTREVRIKVYNMEDAPPRVPRVDKTYNTGLSPDSGLPRELALCLSFRGEQNRARQRGRIYFPAFILGNEAGVRPTLAKQQAVRGLATGFANIGGADVDWCVFSPTSNALHPVKEAWVDDEWDIQRRRGLRPTSRITLSLDE